MRLRRNPRRRRAQRTATKTAKAIRSLAIIRAIVAVIGRRRALALALRGGPFGLLAGLAVMIFRRRRARRQLEADLGPPNQSATGDFQPTATSATATPEAASSHSQQTAPAPNEGATAHEPQPGGDGPVGGEGGVQSAASDGASPAGSPDEPVARQPMG